MKLRRVKLSNLRLKTAASVPSDERDEEENDVVTGNQISMSGVAEVVQRKKRIRKSGQSDEGTADVTGEAGPAKKRSITEASTDIDRDGIRKVRKEGTSEIKSLSSTVKKTSTATSKVVTQAIESVDASAGSDDLCDERTVYIEGLPYSCLEEDIISFFKTCGQIQSVRLPKWHDSGRLRGYGHVQFSSVQSVKLALDLDGCDLKGRYIKVDRPQTPRAISSADKTKSNVVRPAGCRSVFVKNIPYDTTEEEVTETFKVCGPITSVRLAVWGNTKQLKGFGYVDFKREDSAEIAVKKSGILSLKGRPVVIDFETGAPKKSFKKLDGKVWNNSGSQFSKKK